ncbi:hypothetical protein [Streptomyces sp. NPDC059994]|uniref:hypothetical protein n=1 Tax=Streptomyces sp. NPDC059994 TaxID=3347029 RepID=UPI00368D3F17
MTDTWLPLSRRGNERTELRPGVPAAAETPLREWINRAARDAACERVLIRCNLARDPEDGPHAEVDDAEFLAWYTTAEELPDVIDALLNLLPTSSQRTTPGTHLLPTQPVPASLGGVLLSLDRYVFNIHRGPLQELLDDAQSIYTIRIDGRALVHRVDPTLAASVEAAAQAAAQPDRGSASQHLRLAHNAAYALHPDAVRAYSEAIKAVEAAAQATLQPNNTRATLGTMLGEWRQIEHKLRSALPGKTGAEGLETARSMMELLWTGQSSRHGGRAPTPEETTEQARMAVDLATSLVRWFSSGAVSRS